MKHYEFKVIFFEKNPPIIALKHMQMSTFVTVAVMLA